MKKIIFITFVLFVVKTKAQIIFEFDHDSASTINNQIGGLAAQDQLIIVNFEVSGFQYVKINRHGKNISIYDLSHALVQNISLVGLPTNAPFGTTGLVMYLSEQLFNLDAKKEFMYCSFPSNSSGNYTAIYNEDGIILFSDTMGTPQVMPTYAMQQYPIYNTSAGTKMILSYPNGHAKVFGLAGTLSTAIEVANQHLAQAQSLISNPHPNPAINTTNVDYKLPDGIHQGEIVFYDVQGIEIKRFKVDKTFNSLLISTADIPAGTYYYQLQTANNTTTGKKMVVIK